MEAIVGILSFLLAALILIWIEHNHRYDDCYYVHGVDMRGIEQCTTYAERIKWIKSRPDHRSSIHPDMILRAWEQRDKQLDETICRS